MAQAELDSLYLSFASPRRVVLEANVYRKWLPAYEEVRKGVAANIRASR